MKSSLAKATLAAAVLMAPCPPAWAAADKQDVRIINTAVEPVPVAVQGTVTGGVQVTNSPSAPVPAALQPDDLTHLRRKASDHVVLFTIFAGTLRRLNANGTQEANWVVPAGKVLVVTDIDWNRSFPSGTPASTVQFRLVAEGTTSSAEYQFFAPWDGNGLAHGEHHLAGGIIVPSGASLSAVLNSNIFEVYVYGYLASDQ